MKVSINVETGLEELIEAEEWESPSLEVLKTHKMEQLMNTYKSKLVQGMTSSATGEEVLYGYSQQDQLNYSKWANALSLDPLKESVTIGTVSHGVVTLTREQFLQFSRDCEAHEMGLYNKRVVLQTQITNALTVPVLESIPTTME